MKTERDQRLADQQSERELVAHDESLKRWIEAGCCSKCRMKHVIELNPHNVTFKCLASDCGWFAIYPIAIIGNSDRSTIVTTRGAVKAALFKTLDDNTAELYAFDNRLEEVTDDEAVENRATFVDMFLARLSALPAPDSTVEAA